MERRQQMHWQRLVIGAAAFALIGVFHSQGKFFLPWSIAGFCAQWSIKELVEQEKRLQKGWFAKNPNRK